MTRRAAIALARVVDANAAHLLPLRERIRYHFGPHCRGYHELMMACFPPKHFPRAWRVASQGGPPGCSMAFCRTLREMGWTYSTGSDGCVWGDSK